MACFSFLSPLLYSGFSYGSTGKESAPNVGGLGWIPGLGRSPGEGKGYPLQYSGLENSMDCYSPWGCKEADATEQLLYSPNCVCVCVCVCARARTLSRVQLFASPWTVAHQAPLSMGFPRQEY